MTDQRDGNAIARAREVAAEEREAEAWKIAQLAATLAAGDSKQNGALNVSAERYVELACNILAADRAKASPAS